MRAPFTLLILCLHTVYIVGAIETLTNQTVDEVVTFSSTQSPSPLPAPSVCLRAQDYFGRQNLYEKFGLSYIIPHIVFQTETPTQFRVPDSKGEEPFVSSTPVTSTTTAIRAEEMEGEEDKVPVQPVKENEEVKGRVAVEPTLLSPIDIVQILSVASHNVWNLPVDDLFDVLTRGWVDLNLTSSDLRKRRKEDDALFCLKDPEKRQTIGQLYQPLFYHLHKDPTILLSSLVYTMLPNFETPKQMIDLKSFVTHLNYNDTDLHNVFKSLKEINFHIANQTFGTIGYPDRHDLISRLLTVFGYRFGRFIPAIFVNTMFYQSPFKSPVQSIGLQNFGQEEEGRKTEFLETTGYFSVFQDESVVSVRVPLQRSTEGHRKFLTLIQKRVNVSTSTNETKNLFDPFVSLDLEEILQNLRTSNERFVAVQFPSFNFSTIHPLRYSMTKMGLGDTMCKQTRVYDAFCTGGKSQETVDLLCQVFGGKGEGPEACVKSFAKSECQAGLNYPLNTDCHTRTNDRRGRDGSSPPQCKQEQLDQSPMTLSNMVQTAQVRLGVEGFQVSSATDTSLVNRITQYLLESLEMRKYYRTKRQAPLTPQLTQIYPIPTSPLDVNPLPQILVEHIRKDADMRGHGPVVVIVAPTGSQDEDVKTPEVTLRFDNPFLFILEDEKVGPLFIGTAQGTQSEYDELLKVVIKEREQTEGFGKVASDWATDLVNGMYWGCKVFTGFR